MVPLRVVQATRYVTPLREGGSLPGLVEADDDGLYVAKFRGAGQGLRALVAEVIVGELIRAVGLPVPELVALELDPRLGAAEPDPEIQELITASPGTNLGVDFLPGSLPYVAAGGWQPDPDLAAEIVWLDAWTTNVDRTARNPNLLRWHDQLWLIDHGAALYLQHGGLDPVAHATRPFGLIADHVLLDLAGPIPAAGQRLRTRVGWAGGDEAVVAEAVSRVPAEWFAAADSPDTYIDYLTHRLAWGGFAEEAEGARRQRSSPFAYVILRLIPDLERGECLNVGVVVFCRQRQFLGALVTLDAERLTALPGAPAPAAVADHLTALAAIVAGEPGAGPLAQLEPSDRFGWVAAPSSTVVQPSAVHTGLCEDPEQTLDVLYDRLVAARSEGAPQR